MPALLAIHDGAAVNVCPNLQALTDGENAIVPSAVHGLRRVFLEEPPLVDAVCRIRPEEEAVMDYLMAQSLRRPWRNLATIAEFPSATNPFPTDT
jgi:hypothetical protein